MFNKVIINFLKVIRTVIIMTLRKFNEINFMF